MKQILAKAGELLVLLNAAESSLGVYLAESRDSKHTHLKDIYQEIRAGLLTRGLSFGSGPVLGRPHHQG